MSQRFSIFLFGENLELATKDALEHFSTLQHVHSIYCFVSDSAVKEWEESPIGHKDKIVFVAYDHQNLLQHLHTKLKEVTNSQRIPLLVDENINPDYTKIINSVITSANGAELATADELNELKQQLSVSVASLKKLQNQLAEVENSKVWKLKKRVDNLGLKIKSNANSGNKSTVAEKANLAFGKKSRQVLRRMLAEVFKQIYLFLHVEEPNNTENTTGTTIVKDPFKHYLQQNTPTVDELEKQAQEAELFAKIPLLSVVVDASTTKSNTQINALVDSINAQSYKNWELILVCESVNLPTEVEAKIATNNKISLCKNSTPLESLKNAKGDLLIYTEPQNVLVHDAFYQLVKTKNSLPEIDFLYGDEDVLTSDGNHTTPLFKPDWSPDNLLSSNYIGGFFAFDKNLKRALDGFTADQLSALTYNLVLHLTEEAKHIHHIPRLLFHRTVEEQIGESQELSDKFRARKRAIEKALARRKEAGTVNYLDGFAGYSVRYKLQDSNKLVSIIIPTKDQADVLDVCLQSILNKSSYTNYEIILLDNNSSTDAFFRHLEKWKQAFNGKFTCVKVEEPFNFSRLMNIGREHAKGDFLVLLNNDTEVISADWLEGMMEQAQRPSVGVAGVKLLYPNDTIQHAGVIMGIGGAASHVFVGERKNSTVCFNRLNKVTNYSALTAACIMVQTHVYDAAGGFDENFAVEYNDVDFCLKVRELGLNNVYVPHVELYHHESISRGHPHLTKKSLEKHQAEITKLQNKWRAYIAADPNYNINLSLNAIDFSLKN